MAKYQLLLPKMGESVAEATIIKWLKNPGDDIEADEAVMEIATDKVDSEVPSPVSGKLVEQLCKENEVIQVGAIIAVIETAEAKDEIMPVEISPDQGAATVAAQTAPNHSPEINQQVPANHYENITGENHDQIPGIVQLQSVTPTIEQVAAPKTSVRFYSPLVKSIATQEHVTIEELDAIPGTGAEGRLTKDDLIRYIQGRHMRAAQQPKDQAPAKEAINTAIGAGAGEQQPANATANASLEHAAHEQSDPSAHAEPMADQTPIEHPHEPNSAAGQQSGVLQADTAGKHTPLDAPETADPVSAQEPLPAVAEREVDVEHQPVALGQVEKQDSTTAKTGMAEQAQVTAPVDQPVAEVITEFKASSVSGGDEIIEMDRMRRLIAEHMVHSKHTSPHVTSFVEADVTDLVAWREKVKGAFEKQTGEKITFTPIFIEAVVKAIVDFPMINVSVNGTQITKKKDINIGMATALPNGNLIVPVIKKASELSLLGLTKAVNDLAARARVSKLLPDDVKGGTFTITNVGSFGNLMGTPIINQPQVAILAVGAIKKKPAVIETPNGDFIGIRHLMFLSLSYDHRVVDGALGGTFLRKIADYLEAWDVNRSV
jgi:2-oxoglutarate dehydrogenase E2 component (dihydrolipoamide succinyltransferase)